MSWGWRAVSILATGASLVFLAAFGVVLVADRVARKVLGGV